MVNHCSLPLKTLSDSVFRRDALDWLALASGRPSTLRRLYSAQASAGTGRPANHPAAPARPLGRYWSRGSACARSASARRAHSV